MNNPYKYITRVQTKIEYECKLCGKKFDTEAEAFNCASDCIIKAAEVATAILTEQCLNKDGPCPVETACIVSCENMDRLEMFRALLRM